MKGKKFLKILLIILIILLIIFIIDLVRKTIIVTKFTSLSKEYSNTTNFYAKITQENITEEIWRNDNNFLYKRISGNDIRMLYRNEKNNECYIIVDNEQNKIATKLTNDFIIPTLGTGTYETENMWQNIIISFRSIITNKIINEIDCYHIYMPKYQQIFINKETFLPIKIINGDIETEYNIYEINTITDENNIPFPNLNDYEIK